MRLLISSLVVGLALSSVACCKSEKPESRWEKAAQSAENKKKDDLPAPPVAAGGDVNKFFPKDGDGYTRTFTQEKQGFAEAKISKDGKEVATASINDTNATPDAKTKFATAPDKVAGFPLVTVGNNQSAALVANRWQVKISSPALDAAARKQLLERFDLQGLSKLN